MPRTISAEGRTITVPDDATDSEVNQIFNRGVVSDIAKTAPPGPQTASTGVIRPLTQRERFETTYPVGAKGEGLGENLYNVAQNVGVGMFKTLAHPVRTAESVVASVIPQPLIEASRRKYEAEVPNSQQVRRGPLESTPNPIQAIYEMLNVRPGEQIPQAVGQGIATAGLAKMGGPAIEAVTRPVRAGTKIALQEFAGAGREPVAAAMRTRSAREAALAERYQERVSDVEKKNLEAQAEAQGKTAEAKREWVEKEMEHRRSQARSDAVEARRQSIERGQRALSERGRSNAKMVYQNINEGLKQRWNLLRQNLGERPIDSIHISKAVDEAKAKYLMGAPESLTQFNQLTKQLESGSEFMDTPGGPVRVSMPWEQGRAFYTALGDKMYSGELPGAVWKSLDHVRNAIDKELSVTARQASPSIGALYEKTKADWAQFKKDWDDMSNLDYSKSALGEAGSPLARLVRSSNPEAAARALADDRLIGQLTRYQKQGASTAIPKQFRVLEQGNKSLEKVSVPRSPARPEVAEAKLAPQPKTPKPVESLTPQEIRHRRIEAFTGKPMMTRWYSLEFVPRVILKNQRIVKAVAEQPRSEIQP